MESQTKLSDILKSFEKRKRSIVRKIKYVESYSIQRVK